MELPLAPLDPRRPSPIELYAMLLIYAELLARRGCGEDDGRTPLADPLPLASFPQHPLFQVVLLWLVYHGHALHVQPVPGRRGKEPKWQCVDSLVFNANSGIVLTQKGLSHADELLADAISSGVGFRQRWDAIVLGRLTPRYGGNRLFVWGTKILKHFQQPAASQELFFRCEEELAWPTWLDDPQSRGNCRNPKVRLHDLINALNRNQHPYLIHFKGDGTGTRTGWEYR